MAADNNNSTIQNTHLDEFILFTHKADVKYQYAYEPWEYTISELDETVSGEDLNCYVYFNRISLTNFEEYYCTLYRNLENEIILNLQKNISSSFEANKYLNKIQHQIVDLNNLFKNYTHKNLKLQNLDERYSGFYYPYPFYEIEKFTTVSKKYIAETIKYINLCFDLIKSMSFKNHTLSIKNQTTNSLVANSFIYIDLGKTPDKINDFYDCLCNHGFIVKEETKLPVFKKVFSDKEITQKVIWHNGVQALRYLILTLKDKDLIEDPGNSQLSLIVKCFSLADKPDYDFSKFNTLKNPKNRKTLQYLNSAIAHLI